MQNKCVKNKRVGIRLTDNELEMLNEIKLRNDFSFSDILRKGIKMQYELLKYANYTYK